MRKKKRRKIERPIRDRVTRKPNPPLVPAVAVAVAIVNPKRNLHQRLQQSNRVDSNHSREAEFDIPKMKTMKRRRITRKTRMKRTRNKPRRSAAAVQRNEQALPAAAIRVLNQKHHGHPHQHR